MSVDSTETLTRKMAAGDPAAIESFYREYFGLMYREARRCSGRDESTALDLVQDSMIKVLTSIRVIHSSAELTAWTRRLVRSVAIDYLRASARRLRRELRSASSEAVIVTQEQYEQTAARILWIEEQLASTDDTAAGMLRHRFFQGWTLQRIAAACGLKTGAVDGRIRRLVTKLKELAESNPHD